MTMMMTTLSNGQKVIIGMTKRLQKDCDRENNGQPMITTAMEPMNVSFATTEGHRDLTGAPATRNAAGHRGLADGGADEGAGHLRTAEPMKVIGTCPEPLRSPAAMHRWRGIRAA